MTEPGERPAVPSRLRSQRQSPARRAALIVLGTIVVACGLGGISRDRAIQLALDSAEGPVVVISAESGPLDQFTDVRALPDEPSDRMVWAVLLSGEFAGECVLNAAGEEVCPPGSAHKMVLLDYQDGELVLNQSR